MRNAPSQAISRKTSHPLSRLVGWVGLGLMVVMLWLGQSGSSQARLDPYFVVRGDAFGTISPRVLFVLDTSGSMNRRAHAAGERCRWSQCENPAYYESADPDDQTRVSRLYAARRAIQDVVQGANESAEFGFMTFIQNGSETQDPPPMCNNFGAPTRFAWTHRFWDYGGGVPWIRKHETGDPNDYVGAMRLCQGDARRPFAYIRWDELGAGSVISANNETGDVPPSPLISLAQTDYVTLATMQRRVQFFPEFMGVRAQLNLTTDPDQSIVNATVGDYDPLTEVWDNDFYYWPYVDGFPGYSIMDVFYDDSGTLYALDGSSRAGVASEEDWFEGAQLHAPFYVDLSATSVPSDNWGPADDAESLAVTLSKTAPIIAGGVDAVGGTPWADAIGTIPGVPTEDNRAGSHSSVASYLTFLSSVADTSACAPMNVVLVTDGQPQPASQGGATLNERLAALRNDLGASVYVVGFFLGGGELNDMACAAAGACAGGAGCGSPCDDTPANDWDTCADSADPTNNCAYVANSGSELQAILSGIIDQALEVEIDSGQGATVNEFGVEGVADDVPGIQTSFSAHTDYPGWQGHVERRYCTLRDEFDVLLPSCVPPAPEFPAAVSGAFDTFGPCPMSRDWDAGECLALTNWTDRRIFSHDASNNVYSISNPDGTASAQFVSELTTLGHVGGADAQAESDEIVAFLLGRDAPGGWKLPGVSNSAPVVVRRIPNYRDDRLPEVGIRDPHCTGRRYGELAAGTLPDTLEDFAQAAWDDAEDPNYTYQEAVVIGDDYGIIHAFQLDSGNELFGLLPRFAIDNAVEQVANGPLNMGQPNEDLENHIFGVASTLNHGWGFDEGTGEWRHLGVIGMGAGGYEYITLDLSHMNPDMGTPVDVVWTTEDAAVKSEYDPILGETWARPALTYHVASDRINTEPETFLVGGSGYRDAAGDPVQGRALFVANAITGELLERAELPAVVEATYESNFGAVVDPAVASHCISRYWAEAQEAYVADPAGRLFRWDLGRDSAPLTFKHDADSGGTPWGGLAVASHRFPACTGTGTSCSISSSNEGEPFVFGPSVSAFDRIDDFTGTLVDVEENNIFLVALASGSPYDDSTDGGDPANDFHTSLYLLVDDHGPSGSPEGFDIPTGTPKSGGSFAAGDAVSGNPGYMRIAISDIERTREVTPFEGATPFTETRTFSKSARPIRSPRIYVTGVVDDGGGTPTVIDNVEVYYVTYYIYEPGSGECDPRFYQASENRWHPDRGSTYEITFRITADTTNGFEFNSGASGGGSLADFETGFDTGLTLVSVDQELGGECESGNCGATVAPEEFVPCGDNDDEEDATPPSSYVIPMRSKTLDAFTPVEN